VQKSVANRSNMCLNQRPPHRLQDRVRKGTLGVQYRTRNGLEDPPVNTLSPSYAWPPRDDSARGARPTATPPTETGQASECRLGDSDKPPTSKGRVDQDVKVSVRQIETANQKPDRREARTEAGISTGSGSAGGNWLR